MPFQPVTKLSERLKETKPTGFAETRRDAIRLAKENLEKALPNQPPEYYNDLLERILLTATAGGYTIASTADAFIEGEQITHAQP